MLQLGQGSSQGRQDPACVAWFLQPGPALWAEGSQDGVVSGPEGRGFFWEGGVLGSTGRVGLSHEGGLRLEPSPLLAGLGWKVQNSRRVAVGVLWSFK